MLVKVNVDVDEFIIMNPIFSQKVHDAVNRIHEQETWIADELDYLKYKDNQCLPDYRELEPYSVDLYYEIREKELEEEYLNQTEFLWEVFELINLGITPNELLLIYK